MLTGFFSQVARYDHTGLKEKYEWTNYGKFLISFRLIHHPKG